MSILPWKSTLILLFLAILIFLLVTLMRVQVDPYTNMSAAQAQAQEDQWIAEQVAACQQAGGTWQAGFTTAGCNVSYPSPDDDWYIAPIANPTYELWQVCQPLLVVLVIVLIVSVLGFLAMLSFSWSASRKEISREVSDSFLSAV